MATWLENDASWFEERMLFCATCGRMIAKHYLAATAGGGPRIFCSDDCHALYVDYVLPERGSDHRPSAETHEHYEKMMVK